MLEEIIARKDLLADDLSEPDGRRLKLISKYLPETIEPVELRNAEIRERSARFEDKWASVS